MHVLNYIILVSFAQNPAILTFFRKGHSDEREFADLENPEYLTNNWYLSEKNILFVLFFASCPWSDKNDAQNS